MSFEVAYISNINTSQVFMSKGTRFNSLYVGFLLGCWATAINQNMSYRNIATTFFHPFVYSV